MKRIFIIIGFSFLLFSCTNKQLWESPIGKSGRSLYEAGYYYGQRDAMNKKWAVGKDENGKYYWKANLYKFDKDYEKFVKKGIYATIEYVIDNEE